MNAFEIMKSRQNTMNLVLDGTVFLLFYRSKSSAERENEVRKFKLKAVDAYKEACIKYFGDFRGCGVELALARI